MSNGYLVAADADLETARLLADGFGLDLIESSSVGDPQTVAAALTAASNVGVVVSAAAAQEATFVALLEAIAQRVGRAQLILAQPDARAPFPFLPETWPVMSLDDARARATELVRRRETEIGDEPPRAAPLPPAPEPPAPETELPAEEPAPPVRDDAQTAPLDDALGAHEHDAGKGASDSFGAPGDGETTPDAAAPPPVAAEPPAPPDEGAAPQAPVREPARTGGGEAPSAPADATAFAPKKLRRGEPELVRIVVHQPKDLQAVIKAAREIDKRADAAPQGMTIGKVALGASIGVSLDVRGAACDGALQRRTWTGDPADFSFSVEAENDVRQVVILARVFVDDAQIGVLAFTRPVGGAAKKPASTGERVRLKRHKRVFLSYSSKDREVVSAIATAYQLAGVDHFWDRTSLKSGEEWTPRLRREIDRADLFHLCWSRSAASSEWVAKEAEHALTRRRRNKKPEITVQMLDGPPWAKHPDSLDSINFDDFVRAAIVGYARGDGSQ